MKRMSLSGFTLIEMMIVVAIIGILATISVVNYNNSIRKSADALTQGNLGAIRSALSIYYSDNDGIYPTDLNSLNTNDRYLKVIPITRLLPYHQDSSQVTNELSPSETGAWSYNNDNSDANWGSLHVGCMHEDARGQVWSTY